MGRRGWERTLTILNFCDCTRYLADYLPSPFFCHGDAVDLCDVFWPSHRACVDKSSFCGLLLAKAIQHGLNVQHIRKRRNGYAIPEPSLNFGPSSEILSQGGIRPCLGGDVCERPSTPWPQLKFLHRQRREIWKLFRDGVAIGLEGDAGSNPSGVPSIGTQEGAILPHRRCTGKVLPPT